MTNGAPEKLTGTGEIVAADLKKLVVMDIKMSESLLQSLQTNKAFEKKQLILIQNADEPAK